VGMGILSWAEASARAGAGKEEKSAGD